MKMTTEEAFVKVLQMHGIEHAFGIIGSAMMPISDLFPAAGIKFWDCAHEVNAAHERRRLSPASTGKMSMAIAQNGPGITNLVTPIITAYWNHTPMLLVTPQAANKTIGQGGFQESQADERCSRTCVCYQEEVRDRDPHCRGAEPRHPQSLPGLGAGSDQHTARLLDSSGRYRSATDRATFEHPRRQ